MTPRDHLMPTGPTGLFRSASMVLLALTLASLVPLASWGAEAQIVARVNGDAVTQREVDRLLADTAVLQQLRQAMDPPPQDGQDPAPLSLEDLAVDKLILHRLLLQEADRRQITVSEQEVDDALVKLRGQFANLREFGVWMKTQDLDEQNLFETIRKEMLVTRTAGAILQDVRPDEAEIRAYYEAHKVELKTAEAVRLQIIAVADRAVAEEILAAVHGGADFGDLARERSQGMRAAQRGDTGWISRSALPPQLREAIGALGVGDTGGPLATGADYRLVRLVARWPGRAKDLAEARPEIEQRLLPARRQAALEAWRARQNVTSKIERLR